MGFISAPGPLELLVILAVALLFLGPKRLPEAARSVGRGMRELRDALQGEDDHAYAEDEEVVDEERPAAKPTKPVKPVP